MTATSRRTLVRALLVPAATVSVAAALLVGGGCGGAAKPQSGTGTTARSTFGWLRARSAPAGWRQAQTASGATLAYPAGWKRIKGDRGTVSVASLDAHGRFLGYLNLTPRQGAERQASWASFRVRHNLAEGNRDDRVMASAQRLSFATGIGACVKDSYMTSSGVPYIEIACLVGGPHPSVVVGAAPPSGWRERQATVETAISSLRT